MKQPLSTPDRPTGLLVLATLSIILGVVLFFGTMTYMIEPGVFVSTEFQGKPDAMGVLTNLITFFFLVMPLLTLSTLYITVGVGYLRRSALAGRLLGNIQSGFSVAVALLFMIDPIKLLRRTDMACLVIGALLYHGTALYLINTRYRSVFRSL